MTILHRETGEAELTGSPGPAHVCFTLDAIERIETRCKVPVMDLLDRLQTMRLTMAEIRAIVQAGMEGYRRRQGIPGPAVTDGEASAVLAAGGLWRIAAQAMESLTFSDALGLDLPERYSDADDVEADEHERRPTVADDSSSDSSALASIHSQHGG